MKYSTAKEHRDFFHKNRIIEFEGLFSDELAKAMSQGIEQVLATRLKCPQEKLKSTPPEELFLQSRNLWMESEAVKKGVMQHQLGQIAFELFEQKPIRFGYDQYLPFYRSAPLKKEIPYATFLKHPHSLEEASPIQTAIGGLMIALPKKHKPKHTTEIPAEPQTSIFPTQAGSAVFISADMPLDLTPLIDGAEPPFHYLLIVYTTGTSVYVSNREDPLLHTLRHLGYAYGDRLNDLQNPIVFR